MLSKKRHHPKPLSKLTLGEAKLFLENLYVNSTGDSNVNAINTVKSGGIQGANVSNSQVNNSIINMKVLLSQRGQKKSNETTKTPTSKVYDDLMMSSSGQIPGMFLKRQSNFTIKDRINDGMI